VFLLLCVVGVMCQSSVQYVNACPDNVQVVRSNAQGNNKPGQIAYLATGYPSPSHSLHHNYLSASSIDLPLSLFHHSSLLHHSFLSNFLFSPFSLLPSPFSLLLLPLFSYLPSLPSLPSFILAPLTPSPCP
jgi:hypothetical protein